MDKILKKFEEIISNVTSLEVATFTKKESTTAVAMPPLTEGNDGFKTREVFKKIRGSLTNQELVGYIRFEIDGDAIAFINNDPKYADILEYHKSNIEAGQQTRKNIFDTVSGVFK
jgi:hypothetical protein